MHFSIRILFLIVVIASCLLAKDLDNEEDLFSSDFFKRAELEINRMDNMVSDLEENVVLASRVLTPILAQGRLTTETAVGVSTTDRTSQSTLYYTPYGGNKLSIYNGSSWKVFSFTEVSLALSSLTSGKNYDVFVYNSSGSPVLELSTAWTSDTARSDALTTQDGVYVKSGATTRRYLGTIRTTSTTTTEDSKANRFVWNYYNRVPRILLDTETTDSWTINTGGTLQAMNNDTTNNKVCIVIGIQEAMVQARAMGAMSSTDCSAWPEFGIGIDSATTNSADLYQGTSERFTESTQAFYYGYPTIGYHVIYPLESEPSTVTTLNPTGYGDAGTSSLLAGIVGSVEG